MPENTIGNASQEHLNNPSYELNRKKFGRMWGYAIGHQAKGIAHGIGYRGEESVFAALQRFSRFSESGVEPVLQPILGPSFKHKPEYGGYQYGGWFCDPAVVDPAIQAHIRKTSFSYGDDIGKGYDYSCVVSLLSFGISIETRTPQGSVILKPNLETDGTISPKAEMVSYGPRKSNPTRLFTFTGNPVTGLDNDPKALQVTQHKDSLMVHAEYGNIDERGNVQIKDGSPVYVSLDSDQKTLLVSNIYTYNEKTHRFEVARLHHAPQPPMRQETTDTHFVIESPDGTIIQLPLRDNLYKRVEEVTGIF